MCEKHFVVGRILAILEWSSGVGSALQTGGGFYEENLAGWSGALCDGSFLPGLRQSATTDPKHQSRDCQWSGSIHRHGNVHRIKPVFGGGRTMVDKLTLDLSTQRLHYFDEQHWAGTVHWHWSSWDVYHLGSCPRRSRRATGEDEHDDQTIGRDRATDVSLTCGAKCGGAKIELLPLIEAR
jgi:hypothetical protein